jgi:hypothetical protein
MILGSVENEKCFSTLPFMKSMLQNKLPTHLDLVVRMFVHEHYTLYTFPFWDTFKDWTYNKVKYAYKYKICWLCYH